MQKYADYTPAQAAWLDELPSHWQCTKIGALFSERKSKVSDKDYAPLSVARIGVVPQLATAVKTDAGDNRKLVCAGDFVINSRSDRKGSCGVAKLDGSVSLINIVLTPRNGLSERYVHYLLRSQPFSEEYYRNGRGIVADLWTTRYSEMKSILLPVPPREEQDQIVRFLDWKVSNINKLINIKKKEIKAIDALKRSMVSHAITRGLTTDAPMKDSGVKWLGDIPAHWNVTKLRQILHPVSEKNHPEFPLLSVVREQGVILRDVEDKEANHNFIPDDLSGYKVVRKGQFAMNKMKAWQGSYGVSDYTGIVSPAYFIFDIAFENLKDIYTLTGKKLPSVVISNVKITKSNLPFESLLDSVSVGKKQGSYTTYSFMGLNINYWDTTAQNFPKEPCFGDFRDLFVANLHTEARLSICNAASSIARNADKQHPIHYAAFEPRYRKWLASNFNLQSRM